jgi:hypothetical protein
MSEHVDDESDKVILRGEITPDQWEMFVGRATSMGALVVERSWLVERPEAASPDPDYFSRFEFTAYAEANGVKASQGVRAYNGLMRIFYDQSTGVGEISKFPSLRLNPQPEENIRPWDLKNGSIAYNVELRSLTELVTSLDIAALPIRSKSGRKKFLASILPREVGIRMFFLYSGFAASRLDKSEE